MISQKWIINITTFLHIQRSLKNIFKWFELRLPQNLRRQNTKKSKYHHESSLPSPTDLLLVVQNLDLVLQKPNLQDLWVNQQTVILPFDIGYCSNLVLLRDLVVMIVFHPLRSNHILIDISNMVFNFNYYIR